METPENIFARLCAREKRWHITGLPCRLPCRKTILPCFPPRHSEKRPEQHHPAGGGGQSIGPHGADQRMASAFPPQAITLKDRTEQRHRQRPCSTRCASMPRNFMRPMPASPAVNAPRFARSTMSNLETRKAGVGKGLHPLHGLHLPLPDAKQSNMESTAEDCRGTPAQSIYDYKKAACSWTGGIPAEKALSAVPPAFF